MNDSIHSVIVVIVDADYYRIVSSFSLFYYSTSVDGALWILSIYFAYFDN